MAFARRSGSSRKGRGAAWLWVFEVPRECDKTQITLFISQGSERGRDQAPSRAVSPKPHIRPSKFPPPLCKTSLNTDLRTPEPAFLPQLKTDQVKACRLKLGSCFLITRWLSQPMCIKGRRGARRIALPSHLACTRAQRVGLVLLVFCC